MRATEGAIPLSAVAFAKALGKGAVGFVSRLISQAVSPFQIVNDIRHAYPGMNMTEVGQTYQLGVAAYSAGQEISGPTGSGLASLTDIPLNPALVDALGPGNQFRFQILGSFQIPGELFPRFRTLNIFSPNNLSLSELQQQWQNWFIQAISPQGTLPASGGPGAPVPGPIIVRDVERAY